MVALKTVVWKNLIIRRRHYVLTWCEALLPILLFWAMAYGRAQIPGLNKQEVPKPTYSTVDDLTRDLKLFEPELLFAPNNDFYSDIIDTTRIKLSLKHNQIKGFGNTKDLLEYYIHDHHNGTIIAVVFKGTDKKLFDYTLRYHSRGSHWYTDVLYDKFVGYDSSNSDFAGYIWESFVNLQIALDFSYIYVKLGKPNGQYWILDNNFTISFEKFPYPPHVKDDGLKSMFMVFLPLITLISFIFICPAVLKRVVEEKNSGIKELMETVGMKSWLLWLGWIIYSLIPMLISIPMIVIFLKVPLFGSPYAPIQFTDGLVLFVFLSLYCMASVMFCFFISTIFSKPTHAMIIGLIAWILSYAIPRYSLVAYVNDPFPFGIMLLFNILPNVAMHFGYTAISLFEETEKGVHWYNLNQSGNGGTEDITLAHVLIMLVFDIVFYLTLTFYVDSINPGKYGVGKSIFYPLDAVKKLILRLFGKKDLRMFDCETMPLDKIERGEGLRKSIEIHNLFKKFGTKVAVSNLNMDVYKEQITVLLGHNGAGKSTTIAMITGIICSTSGAIVVDGKDTKDNMNEIRQSFGLCPQHNLLFTDLTVSEHLEFFARLKGSSKSQAKDEIKSLLKKLKLEHKANDMAHTLSEGMKRTLCLGMAVIGNSKVLILDEPTSGMDPESRRDLWDLLLTWRGQKTILIATHSMEEADALGDWIAIMANGKLQCYGTPTYLKKCYATGHHLSLVVRPDADVHRISHTLRNHITTAELIGRDGNMLTFVLPFDMGDGFEAMLEDVENKKEALKIESEELTLTTLEDVFLKAKEETESKLNTTDSHAADEGFSTASKGSQIEQKGLAVLNKKMRYFTSKISTYVMPFVICLVLFFVIVLLSANAGGEYTSAESELQLKLNIYGPTKVYYSTTSNDDLMNKVVAQYEEVVRNGEGQPLCVDNVKEAIIEEGVSNIDFYKQHMVAAAEFFPDWPLIGLRFLYSGRALHSAPISLNLLSNAVARALLDDSHSISLSNWPLGAVAESEIPNRVSENKATLLWLLIVPIGGLFVLSSFIFFPQVELSTNFAQQQFMAGVRLSIYWLLNFVTDFVVYFAMMAVVLVLLTFLWTPLRFTHDIGGIVLILALYGWNGVPFTYLFSRKKSASGAYALFVILGLFTGVLSTLVFRVMIESGGNGFKRIGTLLRDFFLVFFPQFGLTYEGVMWAEKVTQNYNFKNMEHLQQLGICSRENNPCCAHPNSHECARYESSTRLLWDEHRIYLMFIGGVLYMFVNVFLHSHACKKAAEKLNYYYYKGKGYILHNSNEDNGTK